MATPKNLPVDPAATRQLSSEANALVDRIRAGDPAAIAPEVYGLDKTLAVAPATVVIELFGTTIDGIASEFPDPIELAKLTPNRGETFAAWMRRMEDEVGGLELSADRYTNAAYAAIGYDWVDWVWLPKGQNTLTADRAAMAAARAKRQ